MAKIILITGGSRSGKSEFAQTQAEALPGPRLFVATSPVTDEAMRERIRQHRLSRDPEKWDTLEEPLALAACIVASRSHRIVLVDCITMWINNLMYDADGSYKKIDEADMEARTSQLLRACRQRPGTVFFVTNELGSGIVPDNEITRVYRDLVGRCNQRLGRNADGVFLVSCGIPLQLK